jgi:hypothetical protein
MTSTCESDTSSPCSTKLSRNESTDCERLDAFVSAGDRAAGRDAATPAVSVGSSRPVLHPVIRVMATTIAMRNARNVRGLPDAFS